MPTATRIFEEKLQKPVRNVLEFCDTSEKIEFMIKALVAGNGVRYGNMTRRGDFRTNPHRQYVLNLAVRRGILTQVQSQ
jgi:hypothetical protein